MAVRYVKPHGALYNQAMRDDPASVRVGEGLIDAIARLGLPLLGQPITYIERLARGRSLVYVVEGFPDRGYREDGRLVPRGRPGAMIEGVDAVAAQALRLVGLGVRSLCLHGDAPEAVARADAILAALDRAGIAARSFA